MKTIKRNFIQIACTLLGFLGLLSCEKPLDAAYEQDARIYFFERQSNYVQTRITSNAYSFLLVPSSIVKDTVYIRVKTMGYPASYDRYTIGRTISEGTTAIEGVDYDFIPGLIPAGEVIGSLPIVLYRTDRLKEEDVILNLTIGETPDFRPGVIEDNLFTYRWSDKLSKPANWDDPLFGIHYYFGAYSDAKYRFMIDVLGIADFPVNTCPRCGYDPNTYTAAALSDFRAHLILALNEYNAANPDRPILDENTNEPITF